MHKSFIKKILLVILVLFTGLLLFSCKELTPTGDSINDDAFLTSGEYTVTNRELWEDFRLSAYSTLGTMLNEELFSEQREQVKTIIRKTYPVALDKEDANYEEYAEWLRVTEWVESGLTTAVWSTSTFSSLESISKNQTSLNVAVEKYLDSIISTHPNLEASRDSLDAALKNCLSVYVSKETPLSTDPYRVWGYPVELLDIYIQTAAKKLYAYQFLAEDVANDEEGNSYYIKDTDLVTYYKNNLKKKYSVEAFIVPFYSATEANNALYKFNLKSNSRGEWTQIPDPRTFTYPTVDDIPSELIHVKNILVDLNISLSANVSERRISEADYKRYYDRYTVSDARVEGMSDTLITDPNSVLELFIMLYNEVNGTDYSSEADVRTEYNYEDPLFTANTSLRDHIYNTLLLPTADKPGNKQYSPRVQTFGSYSYLVFKFSDSAEGEEYVTVKETNEDDEEEEIFICDANEDTQAPIKEKLSEQEWIELLERAEAFKATALEKVTINKFTDTYINEKVADYTEDLDLVIYDNTIYKFYAKNNTDSGAEYKRRNTSLVAKYGDIEISVDQLFARMVEEQGILVALDIIAMKYLREIYYSEITEDDIADYKEQFKTSITSFTQDSYSSNGYPASMGIDDFLLLAFGSKNMDEAFDKAFIEPKLRELFNADWESLYGDGVYEKFAQISKNIYDSYWQTTVSHLLVYVDYNLDGTPDNPVDYYEYRFGEDYTSSDEDIVRDEVAALVEEIYSLISNYISQEAAINAIITEFNSVNRVTPTYLEGVINGTETLADISELEGNEQTLLRWNEFRKQGYFLKWESLGDINNSTNYPASATYDQAFYDRVNEIRQYLDIYRNEEGAIKSGWLPDLDYYRGGGQATLKASDIANVESAFGWHFIYTTAVSTATSAKFLKSSDSASDPKYISEFTDLFGNKYEAYNNYDYLSASQIAIYLKETGSEYGVESIPSAVSSAISAWFTPLYTKLTSTSFQSEFIFRLLLDQHSISYANAEYNDFVLVLREYNRRAIEEYNRTGDATQWSAAYGDMWDILEGGALVVTNVEIEIGSAPNFASLAKAYDSENVEIGVNYNDYARDWENTSAGIYKVVYSAEIDGVLVSKVAYVRVVDTNTVLQTEDREAPTITLTNFVNNSYAYSIESDNYEEWLENLINQLIVSDNVDGDMREAVILIDRWVNYSEVGDYILIIRAVDGAGNEKVASITINVTI